MTRFRVGLVVGVPLGAVLLVVVVVGAVEWTMRPRKGER